MNYLAHIYLSGNDVEQQIGGFIGDFVKGDFTNKFTAGIEKGIKLHRKIDRISDEISTFKKSKKRVRKELSRFSGIFVDIYYDHFLAKHWTKFNPQELVSFSNDFIKQLNSYSKYIPVNAQSFVNYMHRNQLFNFYSSVDNIEKVLIGMSSRMRRENPIDQGILDLKAHYSELEQDFFDFMEEIEGILAKS